MTVELIMLELKVPPATLISAAPYRVCTPKEGFLVPFLLSFGIYSKSEPISAVYLFLTKGHGPQVVFVF